MKHVKALQRCDGCRGLPSPIRGETHPWSRVPTNPCKNRTNNTAGKKGSDLFYHNSKIQQRTKAYNLCQREEELDTKPTQQESPHLYLRSRRYRRNGAEGLGLGWNTFSRS